MAIGDIYSTGPTSITNQSFLDFRPSANQEFTLHNIHSGGAFEIHYTDGTNFIIVCTSAVSNTVSGLFFECNNTYWYRIKNTSGSNQFVGGTGRYSKWD